MRVLLLDNYDSFTYNLYDYLLQTGTECIVVRNDELILGEFDRLDFQAIVLSPGPKRPADAGLMPELIARYATQFPIFGVCLGMQAIGEHFGARLIKARLPMHGKTSLIRHSGHPLFDEIPSPFQVMRYHSLILESLEGSGLQTIAETDAGEIMALTHPSLPLSGVQFHPESVLTDFGLQILTNWVRLAQQTIHHHAGSS
ncbi:MAG: aminodeoxychorismate/anthranilate synthase component II [Bacteroidota bacterium]|jgi:anthranilate synthase component 2/para-aminobenzoate synthetase component 2